MALVLKDNDTEYAVVTKKSGNGIFKVILNGKTEEMNAKLRGKFKKGANKKNNWVEIGGIVLVSIRDFQNNMVDIVHVYNDSDEKKLKKLGINLEIKSENEKNNNIEIDFNFEDL